MRLRIRSTLMFAIVALMACSLSAVSAVVLLRHLTVVQTVADREIEQAASDVGNGRGGSIQLTSDLPHAKPLGTQQRDLLPLRKLHCATANSAPAKPRPVRNP